MKHKHSYLLWIPIFTMITFLAIHFCLPETPAHTVLNAFTRTAKAYHLIPSSHFQTNALSILQSEGEYRQDTSITLQSCQSEASTYDFLDDLSGLRFTLSSFIHGQQTDGAYALQYSAMPLLSGGYRYQFSPDSLAISSNELWDGTIDVSLKDFGSAYQQAALRDFFPMLRLDSSFSLEIMADYLQGTYLSSVNIHSLQESFQSCEITALSGFPGYTQYDTATYGLDTDASAWRYYSLSPSEQMSALFQQYFSVSVTSPITVAIDSDEFVRLIDTDFYRGATHPNDTSRIVILSDPADMSCSIDISHAAQTTADLHAVLSFSCDDQCFQMTASEFTLDHVIIKPLSKTNPFQFRGNITYSISPLPSAAAPVTLSDLHHPILSMSHEDLQSLEHEIWSHIEASPQLKMFLSAY